MTRVELSNVTKRFPVETGLEALLTRDRSYVTAVNEVSLDVERGGILGIVGESGCGKTTLGKLVLRIHECSQGEIRLGGTPIEELDRKELYRQVQMVFQDPFKSLNPQVTVGRQLREPLQVHDISEMETRIRETLKFANLTPPEEYLDRYPHELSGGQKQRVAIARALVLDPEVIVADEPVSMLDVSIRAGVLDLLRRLATEHNRTVIYISHDLATVRHICDELAVMYLGKVMERGPTGRLLSEPEHPYTERLMSATPVPDPSADRSRVVYDGEIPDPVDLPTGCFFKDRCAFATDACERESMELRPPEGAAGSDREVACHRAERGELDWEALDDA
jgi:peptide/nickel transport system ATP-binding protein